MKEAKDVIVISAGQEVLQNKDRKAVATSKVQITFKDEDNLRKCVEALKQSDLILASKVDPLYVWELVSVIGDTVYFGVSWYDRTYFDEKKDIFTGKQHASIFSDFGATADDFRVQHFVAID